MAGNIYEATIEAKMAALGGFLEGISYLNGDTRRNFSDAFIVYSTNDTDVWTEINGRVEHLSGFHLAQDKRFEGGFRQLEQDIAQLILVDSHIADDEHAEVLRGYLSFKIMDRLGDIMGLQSPKKMIGRVTEEIGTQIFYCLAAPTLTVVLYFFDGRTDPER